MKRLFVFALFIFAYFVSSHCISVRAQQTATAETSNIRSTPGVDVDRIINTFIQKETQYRRALNEYSFTRDAVIQTIGFGGQVSGEFHRTSRFLFDDSGNKYEKIMFFPVPTISEIQLTANDLEDLSGVNQFTLDTQHFEQYSYKYVGKERIDEIDTFVFDVAPKIMPDPKKTKLRFFQGRIWVDDHDLQIVKSKGKGVPEGKERFPTVETYRENIDGRYWFPTYAYADDQLVFPNGQVVHMRMRVKYTNFEKAKARVRVVEEGEPGVTDQPQPKATPTPTPSKKP